MPTHKDFKRLVRTRMQKTDEACTAARAQRLQRQPVEQQATPQQSRVPAGAPIAPGPEDYARLAGMSNEAVKAKTGCTWEGWVTALDAHGVVDLPHREIARLVHEKYKVSAWWAQTVTVGYERIRGLRAIGQRRTGAYEANKSRTFAVPAGTLYRALRDARLRKRWLDAPVTVRTASVNKSVRFQWNDGTIVQAYLTPKGEGKTAVAIQHMKLKDKASSDRLKTFWAERLGALAAQIAAH